MLPPVLLSTLPALHSKLPAGCCPPSCLAGGARFCGLAGGCDRPQVLAGQHLPPPRVRRRWVPPAAAPPWRRRRRALGGTRAARLRCSVLASGARPAACMVLYMVCARAVRCLHVARRAGSERLKATYVGVVCSADLCLSFANRLALLPRCLLQIAWCRACRSSTWCRRRRCSCSQRTTEQPEDDCAVGNIAECLIT